MARVKAYAAVTRNTRSKVLNKSLNETKNAVYIISLLFNFDIFFLCERKTNLSKFLLRNRCALTYYQLAIQIFLIYSAKSIVLYLRGIPYFEITWFMNSYAVTKIKITRKNFLLVLTLFRQPFTLFVKLT